MAKELKLADGSIFECSDKSTINDIVMIKPKLADFDPIVPHFTMENLTEVEFDGEEYTDLIPVGFQITQNIASMVNGIIAHFVLFFKTTNEE